MLGNIGKAAEHPSVPCAAGIVSEHRRPRRGGENVEDSIEELAKLRQGVTAGHVIVL